MTEEDKEIQRSIDQYCNQCKTGKLYKPVEKRFCGATGCPLYCYSPFQVKEEESLASKLATEYWTEDKERPPEYEEFKALAEVAESHFFSDERKCELEKFMFHLRKDRIWTYKWAVNRIIDLIKGAKCNE